MVQLCTDKFEVSQEYELVTDTKEGLDPEGPTDTEEFTEDMEYISDGDDGA